MRRILLLLLILQVPLWEIQAAACMGCINFKENKGQWEPNILYKGELKNGAVFFEKQGLTFNLFDTRDILRIKGDHHRLENYQPTIDYTMHWHAFKILFEGASASVKHEGELGIKEYFNYFIGSDRSKWAGKVHAYQQVNYNQLYPGINLQVNAEGGGLKYQYVVSPGADPAQVKMQFAGADSLSINKDGALIINTSVGNITDLQPVAYQEINGKRITVDCKFNINRNIVTFQLGAYNSKQELIIDPTLVFSTYSGSTADNFGYSATYDSKGNGFAAGSVFGAGYPLVIGHYIMNYVGGPIITFSNGGTYPGDDIGITKYNATGTQRIYSTYLGGYGQDLPHSLIVNSNDELYMLGTTDCSNYPVTSSAYDTTFNGGNDPGVFDGIAAHYVHGSDIVISKISADGSQLLASTYVGGSDNDGLNYRAGQPYSSPGFLRHNYADEVRGEIDIDKSDNVYVVSSTRSANFPRSTGTFQNNFGGGLDACVFKMDANLTSMVWSTTFGGSDDDAAYSVSIDNNENLFVAGGTRSNNFPVSSGALQSSFGGGDADGFVTHINKNGQQILSSTYLGYNDYDQIYFVELDKGNNVFVLGQADNAGTNFIKNALYNKPNGGQFIAKITPQLDSLIWSTSWGRGLGVTDISPTAFLVDVCNSVYSCGWGSQGVNNIVGGTGGTTGLDVTSNALKGTTDGQDFYLMVLKDDASSLTYATFIGGNISEEHVDGGTSRFDKQGIVYQSVCAGCGSNDDFPTTPGAVSPTNHSNNCNNAIFKFDLNVPLCLADFQFPNACTNVPVSFTNKSDTVLQPAYKWFFGDSTTSTQVNPTHTYTLTGVYDVTLIVSDPGSCNSSDTITKKVLVIGNNGNDSLPALSICTTQSIQIGIPPVIDSATTYLWSPGATLSDVTVSNPFATPTQTTTYRLLVSNGLCTDTVLQTVYVTKDTLHLQGSDVLCPGDTLTLSVTNSLPNQQFTYIWSPAGQIISGGNTANPQVSPSQNTLYTVTATNQFGCSNTASIQINVLSGIPNVNAFASPDTITFGDTTQLGLTLSGGVATIQWTADPTLSETQIANPLAWPTNTHTYYVEVADTQGCKKRDSVVVIVLNKPCAEGNIYIPNAFTPNNDGKNDVLYVRGNYLTNLYFAVYDRWGQKVFETKDISKGWDGTFKGARLDPAVFGYYAEGLCPSGEKFFKKGNVTLLR